LQEAYPPLAVTLTLEDEIDVSRGDMLVHPNNTPYFSDKLDAQIVWMGEEPLQKNRQYLFKQATKKSSGTFSEIKFKTDVNTLEQQAADQLNLNEIGRCEITLSQRTAFDAYKPNPGTGAFIVIDRVTNVTVAAGMIVGNVSKQVDSSWDSDNRSEYLVSSASLINPAERQERFGQKPKTILLTGLTGSGKSTIAYALERKLFDLGRAAYVLDGQNMRLGPSKDLGFDAEDRSENLRRSAEIARFMMEAGNIVICSLVAPSAEARAKAKQLIGDGFIEVYVDAPLEVCQERDQDGIYQADGVDTIPGVNLNYEAPENPDLVLPTHELSVEDSVERLVKLLEDKGAM
jgi:bifunctional enzyme CysN/CysC